MPELTPEHVEQMNSPLRVSERDALLLDMYRRVGRIEAHTEAVVNTADDHEERLRKIEHRQWSVPGISIIVALLAAFGIHIH